MVYPSVVRRLRLLIVGMFILIAAVPRPLAAMPSAPFAASPQSAPPALLPSDENWSSKFRFPGLNSLVNVILAAPNGDIYVAGEFTQADDTQVRRIARWDGTRWHALGSGIQEYRVAALAIAPDGSLYVGGNFAKAGGVTVNNIARWDGAQWHALGGGLLDPSMPSQYSGVSALVVDHNGAVYATGDFRTAGGVTVNNIARWDGSQWHALGSGLSGVGSALAVAPDNSVYVTGSFGRAGGVIINNIARWDGFQWHALGGSDACPCPPIYALAIAPDGTLYASGSFQSIGSTAASNIARWDGSQWHALGSGMDNQVSNLALSPDGTLYAAGVFGHAGGTPAKYIAQWDGTAWASIPGSPNHNITEVAIAADGSLYVGGYFRTMGATSVNYLARWDGAQWHPVSAAGGQGLDRDVYALATAPDGSLYAGGTFWLAGSTYAAGLARWDGAQWHALGSGFEGSVEALAVAPDGTLYVGGYFRLLGGRYASQVASWDGIQWRVLGAEVTNHNAGSISTLLVAPDGTLYVAGTLTEGIKNVGRWDGTAWQTVGGGLGSGPFYGVYDLVFGDDGTLYAGGEFNAVNGVAMKAALARWDGTTWHAMAGIPNGQLSPSVSALNWNAGSLYVAGSFSMLDAREGSDIARWDGTQWHSLGAGSATNRYISSMAFDQAGTLFIGGAFTQIGAMAANNIARWDGAQWHALGSGANRYVYSLAVGPSGRLFAGGAFTMAGLFGASRIAQWTSPETRCGLTADVPAVFYSQSRPVTVTLRTPGTLDCVSVQWVDASYPNAPAPLQTGAYWNIQGTDEQGQPATGMVFDLSLPHRSTADNDDLVCRLALTWDCAADSFSTTAVTRTRIASFGTWALADYAVPEETWALSDLAVNTSALTSTSALTYTLNVRASAGGVYTVTMDLHPAFTVLGAPGMTLVGQTLSASGGVAPGATQSFTIAVGVAPTFSGAITQTALISGENIDRTLSAPPVVISRQWQRYLPLIDS